MARRTKAQIEQQERFDAERREADERRKAEYAAQREFDTKWSDLAEQIEELWETTDTGSYGEEQIKEKIEQITGASVHDDHKACVEALEGNYYVVPVESKDPLGEFLTTADIDFDDDDACKAVARGCCESRSTFETLALWLELYGFELSRKRAA
jgi:hypothetical protein